MLRLIPTSLRFRVLASLAFGLVLWLGFTMHLSYSRLTALMELGEEASRGQSHLVAAQTRTGIERNDDAYIERAYYDLIFGQVDVGLLASRVRMLRLFDASGQELKSFETLEGPAVTADRLRDMAQTAARNASTMEVHEGDLFLIAEPVFGGLKGQVIGTLSIVWDHSDLHSAAQRMILLQAALGSGAALAILVAIGLTMQRVVLGPLSNLARAIEDMQSDETTSLPSDILGRQDEIGRLAARFRDLLEQLAAGRKTLIAHSEAEIAQRSQQLDAALENMSQGLCMFGPDRRLIVHNQRFAEMYGVADGTVVPGMHIDDLLEICKNAGNSLADRPAQAFQEQGQEHRPVVYLDTIRGGRLVSVSRTAMPDGSWVSTFDDITDRRQVEARIEHMALHDALTGLPNRTRFRQELDQTLASLPQDRHLAVLCLDLDHFKSINDTLGHPVGDELLKTVADRLRACLNPTDLVARLGGDEFAVILPEIQSVEQARSSAERLIEALSEPYEIEGHQVIAGTSIGIALAPLDGSGPDELVKAADLALYRAKGDGRNVCRFFEQDMDDHMQARRALELDLRQALGAGQFEVYYQPIVNLQTGKVSCFEALLRWHHPTRGSVPPSDFIPLAEEIGLIPRIGAWVLQQACHAAVQWPEDVRVAVNLSPVQFRSQSIVLDVDAALDGSGLAPERLELEMTETVLLQQTELTLSILNRLRDLGVRISLDDFGTGYSSLSYLRVFPFDKIKIDRSFIHDLEQEGQALAIVRAITSMGASLGMTTTAEGVETSQQLESLRLEGCAEVQGYYYSPAVRAGDVMPLTHRIEQDGHAVALLARA